MKPFKLSQLITPVLGLWVVAWLLGIITVLSMLGLLMVSGWFITLSAWAGLVAAGSHAFNYLAPSALIRTFAIGRTAGRYGDLLVSHQAIFELLKNLRVRFFKGFAGLAPSVRRAMNSSDSQYRLVKDIDILDEFVLKFISPWVLATAGTVAVFLVIGSQLGVWVWGFLGLMAVLAVAVVRFGIPLAKDETALLYDRKSSLINTLPALTQLLIWGNWQQELNKFYAKDDRVFAFYHKQQRLRLIAVILMQWLVGLLVLLVLMSGANALTSQITATNIAYLLAMVLGVFGLGEIVGNLVAEPLAYGRSISAKDRLNALLSTTNEPKKEAVPERFSLRIYDLVTRQPNGLRALPVVNMQVRVGVPMLISGVSGGGKSTLLDTIAGEIEPVSGQMLAQVEPVEGVSNDIKTLDWQSLDWQGELGYLGQRIDIFNQTLADNLRLGKPSATDEELFLVLDTVGLGDWVRAEPLGLLTPLGEYGTAVSGGQARRIALARLLLSPKKVLLLDEPFAGLDETNRYALWHKLNSHQKEGLLIVVTHHEWQNVGEVDSVRIGV